MKEVTERDLIFWLSEAEMLSAFINDHAMSGNTIELRKAVHDFRTSLSQFKEVLGKYKDSKVVNPKILMKGYDFAAYGDIVLDKCYKLLQEKIHSAPENPGNDSFH